MRYTGYLPHGLNEDIFKPLKSDDKDFINFKNKFLGKEQKDFILFFNSRNIRRKQIPDALHAWKLFLDRLEPSEKSKCLFILHTSPVDQHGTDLISIIELLGIESYVKFSTNMLAPQELNYLYNLADATILLTNNEGWGLSLTESMLAGTPFIANVTGGMIDQMRFAREGKWTDISGVFPTDIKKMNLDHGTWAYPVYPTNASIQGSIPTPYILDDRCNAQDAADQIHHVYSTPKEDLESYGLDGRNFCLGEANFTSKKMGETFIKFCDTVLENFKGREEFQLLADSDYKKRTLKF